MITSQDNILDNRVSDRLGERAQIVLRIGFPRLIHHSKELARAINAFESNRHEELSKKIARIPGAEALSVIARLPESMRIYLLKGRQISSSDRRRLTKVFERLGHFSDTTSAAFALQRLAPDSAADVPADLPEIVHDRAVTNVPPAPAGGFFGRTRELDQIEEWFQRDVRRITISGLGGQGKTALAQQSARWLVRSEMFRAAIFLDYAKWVGLDPLRAAIDEISGVLGESLADDLAVETSLWRTPTLLILDGLDAVSEEALVPLLDASVPWSEAGGSRVLCTTRRRNLGHRGYQTGATASHSRIALDSLGDKRAPNDALEWFAALNKLPPRAKRPLPSRKALIELFDKIQFHPLSIRLLAQQLKTEQLDVVAERLDSMLVDPRLQATFRNVEGGESASLVASLQLSFAQLDARARAILPRFGVFQGGAFEDDLLAVTELGGPDERARITARLAAVERGDSQAIADATGGNAEDVISPETAQQLRRLSPAVAAELRNKVSALPDATDNLWPRIRAHLEAAALIVVESVPGVGVPYLRFHPTLGPFLLEQLSGDERSRIAHAHRGRYAAVARYLYYQDSKLPHVVRAIARRELPNLLHAVYATLDCGEPGASEFAEYVGKFLVDFGLRREADALFAKASAYAGKPGSQAWFLVQSNRAEQLRTSGSIADATQAFELILREIGDSPTYERALTLGRLSRCFRAAGRPDLACQTSREELTVLDQLDKPESEGRKHERFIAFTDLADALADAGQYMEARRFYEQGLAIVEELSDSRSRAILLGQLGTLAMNEGDLNEAVERHQAALAIFAELHEPANEAVAWNQLGIIFQEARNWAEAERHFRESARIKVQIGNVAGAAQTWSNLAAVNESLGRPEQAERWYQESIEAFRSSGNDRNLAAALSNLADFLRTQPNRLREARVRAEEALAIKATLEPGANEIWKTYGILAEVVDLEARENSEPTRQAALRRERDEYRQLAREARLAFPGTRTQLRRFAPVVVTTVLACGDNEDARQALAQQQVAMREGGGEWTRFAAALDRVLAGERSSLSLSAELGPDQSALISYILEALENPIAFQAWASPGTEDGAEAK